MIWGRERRTERRLAEIEARLWQLENDRPSMANHIRERDRELRRTEAAGTIGQLIQQIKILREEQYTMAEKGKRNLKTDATLRLEGYQFAGFRKCTYQPCTADIELWRTPNGRIMPFHRVAVQGAFDSPNEGKEAKLLEPHFGLCLGIAGRQQARAEGRPQEPENLSEQCEPGAEG